MSKRGKHTKRVFAMLLAFIMCLSQTAVVSADEVSDNKTVPEKVAEESAAAEPETGVAEETTSVPETLSDEEVPEEPVEAVFEEATSMDAEEAAGDGELVSGNFIYEVNAGKVTILGLSNDSPSEIHDLVIPDTINNMPVTAIGESAFRCKELKGDLTIPDSVIIIGDSAFYECSGFNGTLTIGSSVKTIGNEAFYDCSCLSGDLTIPNSVETIGECAFFNCSGFNGTLSIGNNVKTIGGGAFCGCSHLIGDLTIPDSVEIIGDKAFSGCTGFDGTLTIGNNVKTIGGGAFYGCSYLIGDLTIPNSVIIIGESAFYECTGFNGNLTIGSSVKTISDNAFENCIKLSGNLIIPDSVETIGKEAFSGCGGLKGNLTLGRNLRIINDYSFCQCGFKGSLTIPDSVTYIGESAFYEDVSFNKNLTIGKNVRIIGKEAFYRCEFISGNLIIPDSVISIGKEAFAYCWNLSKELSLPAGLGSIGEDAFIGCNSISSIRNNSSQSMPVSWFWENLDTSTKCFSDENNNKLDRYDSFSKGIYIRKRGINPTGVSLNKTSLEVSVGTPETLKATVSPANSYWDEVSWNSSDKSVATVSDGVVTGNAPGKAVITATSVTKPALSASCIVTVLDKPPVPVTGVTLNKSALGMYPNETETLTATVTPLDAKDKTVKWFSSNEKVATVNNGVVTSVSPGSAVITVSTNDGGFTAKCSVTVYTKAAAHKVIFKYDDGSVYATQTVANGKQASDPGAPSKAGFIFIGWSDGASIWNFTTPVNKDLVLTAKYKAEQVKVSENTGSGMDPTPITDAPEKKGDRTAYKLYLVKDQSFTAGGKGWTTTDKGTAAVVAKTGKITGKKTGTATVENDTTVYTVYVATPSVSKNSKNISVLVGQSAEVGIDLQAVAGTENKYPVTWYSANPKVAVVNNGMVTGVAKGSTKVIAYIGGKAFNATVKVIDTYKAPAKYTDSKAEFAMNPLQSFGVKFDSNVFIIKNAVWSGDGMTEVKNSKGNVTGYKNGVISIATSGKFTAIGTGTTTVTGTDSKSNTVTVTVTVVPVATKEAVYITKGKTDTIKFPKVTNKNADWWKSSNENAATVDTVKKTGKVTAKAYGRSDISCLYKGFTFNTTAYIEDPEMIFAGKTINIKDKVEMKAGEMKQFKVSKVYQTLNYKSSKQAVVFVDENGFVYARKPGKATISTKINGATYKFTVEVK